MIAGKRREIFYKKNTKFCEPFWQRKLDRAVSYIDISIRKTFIAVKRILPHSSAGSTLKADCYDIISECYRRLDHFEKTILYLNKAIKIYRIYPKKKNELAVLLIILGGEYEAVHKYEFAISNYEKAIKAAREDKSHGHLDIVIQVLLSGIYSEMREFGKAERLLHDSITQSHKNKFYTDLATAHQQLGDLYLDWEKFEKVENTYLNGLEWINHSRHPINPKARLHISLIDYYRVFEKGEKLSNWVQKVEQDNELMARRDIKSILFQYYINQKEYEIAKFLMLEIEEESLQNKEFRFLSYFYPSTLRLFIETNNLREGTIYFNKSIELIREKQLWESEWLIYDLYGQLLENSNQDDSALMYYKKSVQSLEYFRSAVPEPFDRIQFFEDKIAYYTRYCCLALKRKKNELALYFLESSKSKTLIDLLSNDKIVNHFGAGEIRGFL